MLQQQQQSALSPVSCSHCHRWPTLLQPLSASVADDALTPTETVADTQHKTPSTAADAAALCTENASTPTDTVTDTRCTRICHWTPQLPPLASVWQSLPPFARLCCSHCHCRWPRTALKKVTPSRTTDTDATTAAAAAAVCSLAILWQSLPPSVYGRIDTRCGRHPTHSTTSTAVDTAALSTPDPAPP